MIEVLLSERSEDNVHQLQSLWSLSPDWDSGETFSLGAAETFMTSKPWKMGVGVGGAWLEFASEDTSHHSALWMWPEGSPGHTTA